jgi:fumarate reductase subunit C
MVQQNEIVILYWHSNPEFFRFYMDKEVTNFMVYWLALQFLIHEVMGSILRPDTCCAEVFIVFLCPFRQMLG